MSIWALDSAFSKAHFDTLEAVARRDSGLTAAATRDHLGFIDAFAQAKTLSIDNPSKDTVFSIWIPVDSFWTQKTDTIAAKLAPGC